MSTPAQEDDVIIESSSSGSATPVVASNPGTPRSAEFDVRSTPPPGPTGLNMSNLTPGLAVPNATPTTAHQKTQPAQSKYAQLLAVIEDMGKDIRPTYSGSKTSSERLKRGIVHARILVRECLMECERAART